SPATSPIEPSCAASIGGAHTPSGRFFFFRSCTSENLPGQERCLERGGAPAVMNLPKIPRSTPRSSPPFGPSPPPNFCFAPPPGRTSKPSSIPADFAAERTPLADRLPRIVGGQRRALVVARRKLKARSAVSYFNPTPQPFRRRRRP